MGRNKPRIAETLDQIFVTCTSRTGTRTLSLSYFTALRAPWSWSRTQLRRLLLPRRARSRSYLSSCDGLAHLSEYVLYSESLLHLHVIFTAITLLTYSFTHLLTYLSITVLTHALFTDVPLLLPTCSYLLPLTYLRSTTFNSLPTSCLPGGVVSKAVSPGLMMRSVGGGSACVRVDLGARKILRFGIRGQLV